MNRTDAIAYIESQYSAILTATGFDMGDLETALANVLDDSLLALGTPYASLATATIPDDDVIGFRSVLRMFTLKAAYDAALAKVDVSISDPSVSKQYSQLASNLKTALDRAVDEAGAYVTVSSTGFTTGAIVFGEDFLGEYARGLL